jgi:hypothetical protein
MNFSLGIVFSYLITITAFTCKTAKFIYFLNIYIFFYCISLAVKPKANFGKTALNMATALTQDELKKMVDFFFLIFFVYIFFLFIFLSTEIFFIPLLGRIQGC